MKAEEIKDKEMELESKYSNLKGKFFILEGISHKAIKVQRIKVQRIKVNYEPSRKQFIIKLIGLTTELIRSKDVINLYKSLIFPIEESRIKELVQCSEQVYNKTITKFNLEFYNYGKS